MQPERTQDGLQGHARNFHFTFFFQQLLNNPEILSLSSVVLGIVRQAFCIFCQDAVLVWHRLDACLSANVWTCVFVLGLNPHSCLVFEFCRFFFTFLLHALWTKWNELEKRTIFISVLKALTDMCIFSSLLCVKKHKEDSGCSGVRNKTAFVALSHFDEMTLLSGENLLNKRSHFCIWKGSSNVLTSSL